MMPLALMRGVGSYPSGTMVGRWYGEPNRSPLGPESSPWLIVLDWGHMSVPRWCF